jgi:hypothetical protein
MATFRVKTGKTGEPGGRKFRYPMRNPPRQESSGGVRLRLVRIEIFNLTASPAICKSRIAAMESIVIGKFRLGLDGNTKSGYRTHLPGGYALLSRRLLKQGEAPCSGKNFSGLRSH